MALKYQIGVDAGGTHSTAIAYDETGKEIGRAEGGPGQINADYEGGIKNISDTINELIDKVDGDCMRVLVGIAGLSVVGNAPEVAATISSRINNLPTRAITDSLLALYAGLEGDDGAFSNCRYWLSLQRFTKRPLNRSWWLRQHLR